MNNLHNVIGKVRLGVLFGAVLCGVLSYAQEISDQNTLRLVHNSISSESINNFSSLVNQRNYTSIEASFSVIDRAIDTTILALSRDGSQTVKDNFSRAKNQFISGMMSYIDTQYNLFEIYTLKDSLRLDSFLKNRVKLLCEKKFFQTYGKNGVTRSCGGLEIFIPAGELLLSEIRQGLGNSSSKKWYKTVGIISSVVVVATIVSGLWWWSSASSPQASQK